MYATCTFCYASLGQNRELEHFPVARRVAFDPKKGCLWAICPSCAGWNLAPLEERWEAVEECERRFRGTTLRYSSGMIGLASLPDDIELIRIGPALRPEVAAWRYGRLLARQPQTATRVLQAAAGVAARTMEAMARRRGTMRHDVRAALSRAMVLLRGNRVMDLVRLERDADSVDVPLAVVRYRHLLNAALVRPAPWRPWALQVAHDHGVLTIEGDVGIRTAARLLGVINRSGHAGGFSADLLSAAVRKVDESALPDSYFNRVLAIALRADWGRGVRAELPELARSTPMAEMERASSDMERLVSRLTGRTFWGQGGIGSEPRAALIDVPLVDRVALEMAAHEETERRALDGELAELEAAWREADEVATIADALLDP